MKIGNSDPAAIKVAGFFVILKTWRKTAKTSGATVLGHSKQYLTELLN